VTPKVGISRLVPQDVKETFTKFLRMSVGDVCGCGTSSPRPGTSVWERTFPRSLRVSTGDAEFFGISNFNHEVVGCKGDFP
jgi:hypothetical protein